MVKEKHYKSRQKKPQIAALCIFLVLSLVVGGTLAYMYSKTNQIDNKFKLAEVTCNVNANSDGSFDVTNTGDIDAYIRAAIVVNWMDDDGNVRGIAPAASEYTLTLDTTDWWLDTDTGYYYYKYPVSPKAITNDLVKSYGLAADVTPPAGGYDLAVEVVAEAIQAAGTTDEYDMPAVTDAWGVTVDSNGYLIKL